MPIQTRNGMTISNNTAEINGAEWRAANLPLWDSTTFGVGDAVLCTDTSKIFICDISGYFTEL
jgi:hypothetical protein